MSSSPTISLFNERPEVRQSSASFFVSIVVHTGVAALVLFGIITVPQVTVKPSSEHVAVRHLDLQTPQQKLHKPSGSGVNYPGPRSQAKAVNPGGNPKPQMAALRQAVHAPPAKQTLVQPDLPTPKTPLPDLPVPTVVVWQHTTVPVKTIVAAEPQKPPAANATPSADLPNEETNLADIALAATDRAVKVQPVQASNTSPVVIRSSDVEPEIPSTPTTVANQPTPAAVMSLSDVKMTNGTLVLPPANQSVAESSPGALAPGEAHDASAPGRGNPASDAGGVGKGLDAPSIGTHPTPSGANMGLKPGPGQGEQAGAGAGDRPAAIHIKLPQAGQFGSVVVGSSMEEKFPEVAGVWNGRMAYTVYLHVGTAKSWILQYSLPRDVDAANAGNVARIEPPWPFDITRPTIAPGSINADALMVHGFVTPDGRFDALAIVFPADYPQSQFILDSLNQWQFRAAVQDGQPARVEVLLIIPEEIE